MDLKRVHSLGDTRDEVAILRLTLIYRRCVGPHDKEIKQESNIRLYQIWVKEALLT